MSDIGHNSGGASPRPAMETWNTPDLSSRKRQIARLLLAGKTRVETACIAQCALAVVTRVINELGLQMAEPDAVALPSTQTPAPVEPPPTQTPAPVELPQKIATGWTFAQESQLRQLWDVEGRSASACAEIIGVSRNGIIGKVRRMGLKGRPSPIRRRDPAAPPPEPRARAMPSSGAQIVDLTERTCRYPHGHPGTPGFRFCARTTARPGLPYCAEHMAACYRSVRATDTSDDVIAGIIGKPVPARRHLKRAIFGTVAS